MVQYRFSLPLGEDKLSYYQHGIKVSAVSSYHTGLALAILNKGSLNGYCYYVLKLSTKHQKNIPILILIYRVGLSKPQRWRHLLGPWWYPMCLCVCVMCSWEPCTVFSKCAQPYTSFVSLYQVTQLPMPRAPVGRTALARQSSEPVAGQPPSTQPTAGAAWNISVN